MFDKLKGLFETYSQSKSNHKDPTLRTFDIKMGAGYAANTIIEILKELKYKTIRYNDVYNEIFTSKAGYEVTVNLIASQGGSTTVSVSVYSPVNRGRTRKALRFLLNKFKETFKPYITYE